MGVDMRAGRDRLAGKADNLIVFPNRLAGFDRTGHELVAGRNRGETRNIFPFDHRTGLELLPSHHDIVGGVKAN